MAKITVAVESLIGANTGRQYELNDNDLREILNWARQNYRGRLEEIYGRNPGRFYTDSEVFLMLAQKWLRSLADEASNARQSAAIRNATDAAIRHAAAGVRKIAID